MGEGECEPLPEEQPKKSRHRKKHLYNTILQQMEFYFSDSNLTKDRFLSQLLAENPYVEIEIFLKFNKIRKLNCSVEDIQKAIRKSDIIELSEDGLKIHRKKPVKPKENVDLCTIYIENIKADATHDTLSQIFSDFGNVVYVSIPKYKHNKANKGFAFIEYETEEQANEAILFFESIGCKISPKKNPEELQSILTFEGDELNKLSHRNQDNNTEELKGSLENSKKRKLSSEDNTDSKELKTGYKEMDNKLGVENQDNKTEEIKGSSENSKKRKFTSEDKTDSKHLKTSDEEMDHKLEVEIHDNKIKEMKDFSENSKERSLRSEYNVYSKILKADAEVKNENRPDVVEEIDGKKKKNKKEKRKNFIKDLGMQILSKKEWKKLRNRYLELQRKKMKEFKQYLNRQKFTQKKIVEPDKKLSYVPGLIVKLKLTEACIDVKKLKNEIKTVSPEVKFVDIPLPAGSEEVFIRFSTNNAAKDFCEKDFNGEKTVIEGDEEKEYWEKIENDRTVKFQKLAKKQRGREKLFKKAEKESAKHLRFDECDL